MFANTRGHAPKKRLVEAVVFDGHEYALKVAYHEALKLSWGGFGFSYIGDKTHPHYRYFRGKRVAVDRLLDDLPRVLGMTGHQFFETDATIGQLLTNAEADVKPLAFTHGVRATIFRTQNDEDTTDFVEGGEGLEAIVVCSPYHAGLNAVCAAMKGRWLKPLRGWHIKDCSPLGFISQACRTLGWTEEMFSEMAGEYNLLSTAGTGSSNVITLCLAGAAAGPVRACRPMGEDAGPVSEAFILPAVPVRKSGLFTETQITEVLRNYQLDDYQRLGVHHLLRHTSALLADDMGLGKTRQAVVAADIARRGRQVLVACPASLLLNWQREIEMICPGAKIAIQVYDPKAEWVICNYERLGSMIEHARRFVVMLLDEAHVLKKASTGRAIAAFNVAQHIEQRMILTGTPILNTEAEMYALLKLSGHPMAAGTLKAFGALYSGSPTERRALNREIEGWMLRREKTILNLKGKRRTVIPLPLSPAARTRYKLVVADPSTGPFEKITALRRLLEREKIQFILDSHQSMAPGSKSLVFCEFKETLPALKAALAEIGIQAVTLCGSDNKNERQKAVDTFQTDPRVRCFIGTTGAAGVGITLTAACHTYFAGLPWTMAMLDQAEDRANRRGQENLVLSHIPTFAETIDEQIWDLLQYKGSISDEVVQGKVATALKSLVKAAA